ncbi:hypothetical protein BBP40_005232 [Aspergillus hancockii]|nr:hypothetical protein BBP40_005232 [Aspergillus hancockii]
MKCITEGPEVSLETQSTDMIGVGRQTDTLTTWCRYSDLELISLLLNNPERHSETTEAVLQAAAANIVHGEQITTFLLSKYGNQIQISQDVLTEAAANVFSGRDVMEVLFNWKGGTFTVSEKVVKTAAANWWSGTGMVELLQSRRPLETTLTAGVLKAAASNPHSGMDIIRLFPEHNHDCVVHVTEGIVNVVAAAHTHSILSMLLGEPPCSVADTPKGRRNDLPFFQV